MKAPKKTSLEKTLSGLALFLPALLGIACEKIEAGPAFDEAPLIELTALSKDTLVQFTDQLVLTIRYQDGDGDLGNPDPDVNSIFVKDSRLEEADEYYLGPLAPPGSEVSIQGNLELHLAPTFLLGNGDYEAAEFSIHVVDRAGHRSNTIETGAVILLRD